MSAHALLPAGLRDVLPPEAAFEAAVETRLLALFAHNGYERVEPPLVEFEESFLAGEGAAIARDTFRVMDPISQAMMVVRSDITLQVARIARTRLAAVARPLRLAYAGQVLRVTGGQLRSERQVAQAGIELLGSASVAADAEVARLAFEALETLGLGPVTLDLNAPGLVRHLMAEVPAEGVAGLRDALDRKDMAAADAIAGPTFAALIAAAGEAGRILPSLSALDLPPEAAGVRDHLIEVADAIARAAPGLRVTVDPVEHRGFEYYSGAAFSLFVRGGRGEVGRGGRYMTDGETGAGATLYLDAVHRLLNPPEPRARLFLPFGTAPAVRRRWQSDGWIAVAALEPGDAVSEARRLACGYVLGPDGPEPIGGGPV